MPDNETIIDDILTLGESSAYTGVSPRTIERYASSTQYKAESLIRNGREAKGYYKDWLNKHFNNVGQVSDNTCRTSVGQVSDKQNSTESVVKATELLNVLPEIAQPQTPPPTKNPMENKDYIDFKVLQITHKQLEHYYGESTAKIKKLEDKIDALHEDNKNLLRDNSTKEDKHSLALDRVRLDMDKESKAGLSGLMGELSANPQIIEAVVGFINPKHPMFDKEPQIALEGAPDSNREIKYTDDATVNMMLNDIPRVLSQKDGETMTKIYLLFQEFISKPESLDQAVSTFLPDYKY